MERCLLLFTKPARPGRVKTRLIGELSPEQAAELHDAFLADLCRRLARGSFDLRVAWALEDGEQPPPGDLPALRQRGDDLGQRLYHALQGAALSHRWVAAVGSDHPTLTVEAVDKCFRLLEEEEADLVLGPATDGGYYLVGLAADGVRPELFEGVPWSTGEVLEATLARSRRLGLRAALLQRESDVDTPADLEALSRLLAAQPERCPRTSELLGSWGRVPSP